ncbi:divergent PAP2 family protein [Acutalibacter sp. LFL-21]|uniref:divergent PAP2 family protein n=1 Tax=Acutalibacter sp. LFL-21 TaxID=2983399 RepID=UPI0021D66213|nr:divergent PAP2 family protein [Acutalibacter sp. LFL-21]MCU7652323.1 divergent PAP2 family protein [Acutalibacter sp. LFL-21]
MDFSFFLSNPLINVGLVSWLAAQGIKTILDAVKHRSFNKQRLAGAGGMPSSHSAVCCSVVLTSYFLYGFQSPVFALAFIVALIVMYDATGVRWAAGLHAKAINQIVEYLDSGDVNDQEKDLNDLIPKLNESLGHRVIEVICGALLGVAIAVIGQLLRQGGAHLI